MNSLMSELSFFTQTLTSEAPALLTCVFGPSWMESLTVEGRTLLQCPAISRHPPRHSCWMPTLSRPCGTTRCSVTLSWRASVCTAATWSTSAVAPSRSRLACAAWHCLTTHSPRATRRRQLPSTAYGVCAGWTCQGTP